jgi:hypothetical protein
MYTTNKIKRGEVLYRLKKIIMTRDKTIKCAVSELIFQRVIRGSALVSGSFL